MLLIILSIVSLIKAFLIVSIFFLIIRWISKLFSSSFSENSQNHPAGGETTIQSKKKDKKNIPKKKGEYVDFEEIE